MRRFVEEEIALFEDFVCRWVRVAAAAAAAATRLHRAEAPQSRAAALVLPGASLSSVPDDFLGFNAPLLHSELLGRRWVVEIPGNLGAVRRLDERALDGGDRRSHKHLSGSGSSSSSGSSGEVSGAQRVSHLEASLSIYSLSPNGRCCKRAVEGAGPRVD